MMSHTVTGKTGKNVFSFPLDVNEEVFSAQGLLAIILGSHVEAALGDRSCSLGETVKLLDQAFPEVFTVSAFFSYMSQYIPIEKLELNFTCSRPY